MPRSAFAATLLFTDIVGSTEHAVRLGDSAWRQLLARHNAGVQAILNKHQGRGEHELKGIPGPRAVYAATAT
jgi:class 3 adenylate cyclase